MKIRLRLYIYLIIFVGITLYVNSLSNSFIGDDFDQIVDNTSYLHPRNTLQFFTGSTFYGGGGEDASGLHYRPLMLFFYSLIYTAAGLKPVFFHLFQILLHTANTIMLFLFLRYFFKNPVAFFLALLFLVHPINNETVVYIANLQDTLFLFFGLLGTLLIQSGKIHNTIKSGVVLTILLLLSLFSKETGILFAAIYILQSVLFKKIPFKFTLITSLIATLIYLATRFLLAGIIIPTQAIAPIAKAPLLERLLHIPSILLYYTKTFFYPIDLATTQFWFYTKPTFQNFILPLLLVILLSFLLIRLGKKLHNSPSTFNTYLFFLAWLILGLSVHLHIIPLEMTVADRWFYFSFIGVLGLLGMLYTAYQKNLNRHTKPILLLIIVILGLYSFRTYIRNMDWKDPITLYEHDTKIDKNNFFLENSLGSEYLMQQEYEKARPHIEKSLKLNPYFGNLNNMAVLSSKDGDTKKAKEYLEKAIRTDNNYIVTENYAKFLYSTDTPQNTESFITSALKRYPNNATLWMYYGLTMNKMGKYQKAVEFTKKAYDLSPNDLTESTYKGIKGVEIPTPN
jgi:protein O-mannosyl-transferase